MLPFRRKKETASPLVLFLLVLFLLGGIAPSSAQDITTGLKAHWTFNETSGAAAADSSGNSNSGTVSGAAWDTGGHNGGCLSFNGLSDHVLVSNSASLNITGQITIASWVLADTGTPDRPIVEHGPSSGYIPTSFCFLRAFFNLWYGGGGGIDSFASMPGGDVGTWTHVAIVYDGTAWRLYRNGVQIDVNTNSQGATHDLTGRWTLGASVGLGAPDADIPGTYFDGKLDEIRIYSRGLTAADISALHLYTGSSGSSSSLVGHWKLDETSGTTAADSSTYSNDGTVNGTVAWTSAIYGNGHDFDYTDGEDYVEIPNSSTLENVQEGSYTLAAWFKPGSIPPGTGSANDVYYGILLKQGNGTGIFYNGNGEFEFTHFLTGPTWSGVGTSSTSFSAGKYYHVAGVVDRGAGTLKIYVNGTLYNTATFTAGAAAHEFGTTPWRIGIHEPAASTWGLAADGTIDDVRIYGHALTDEEIAELYGLMGHWKMDETSGTVATDATVFGNDGTYTGGPTLGNCGPYENAANFDGINDHVDLPDMDIDYSGGFSAAVWIKPTAEPNTFYAFFGTANGVSDDEIWFGYVGTFLELFVSDTTDGSDSHVLLENSPVVLNQWQHCVVTIDATGNGKLYRNGVETASGFVSLPANVNRGENFIGKSVFDDEFPGALDDVRVYNRALTARQVAELYGLVGHWKLDETSGTVAVDSSATDNDGTYTNGVLLNQAGNIDQAAEFDGLDDYVSVPDDPSLQMNNAFSLSAWIRADSSSNIDQMILNKEGEYEIAISPSDELKWGITNTDPGWSWHGTGHIVAIGKWTYVAITYDNGTVSTYANGVLVDTYNGSGAVGDQYTSLNELRLGGRSNNPSGKYFDGRLDDVRVFKRSLCPEEIFGQYKAGRPAGIRILQWVEVR